MEFKDLVKKVLRYNKDSDIALLERAYKYSENIVSGKIRASGKPWINHYLDVAYEVADLKLDDNILAAALMHGIIDKGADVKELRRLFKNEVVNILENIKKMSEVKKNLARSTTDAGNLRKVLLAASKDIKALLIKICDKVVNLRELQYLSEPERKRISKECIEIYAPLAYRLGIGKVKTDIEDLAFKYLDEENYKKIENKVNTIRKDGEKLVFKFKRFLEKELEKEGIKSIVQSRVKHIYGIYKKIVDRNYNINDMNDILGFRIIVNNIDDCYKVLRVVHHYFRPVPDKFKDYIAMPKPNGYQSLHTAVVDELGKIFEVQIRTEEMHEISEEGIAAHFSYKKITHEEEFDKKLGWLKQLVGAKDSIGSFDIDFFGDEVFAFTPKGKVIELPRDSTLIDFAYAVHSYLGDHCMGGNLNGRFVPLREKIDNGDVVEILTSKTQKPSREWLKFAKTTKAKTKIKQALKESGKIATRTYSTLKEEKKNVGESLLVVDGDKKLKVKLALCCKPVPGNKVIGIKSSNVRLIVHKKDCKDIIKTKKNFVKVGWREKFKEPVVIIVDALDRPGLLKEILNNMNKFGVNISKAKGKTINKDNIECSFGVDVENLDKLNDIISRINKIKNVRKVYLGI